jgi:hypothetical protein
MQAQEVRGIKTKIFSGRSEAVLPPEALPQVCFFVTSSQKIATIFCIIRAQGEKSFCQITLTGYLPPKGGGKAII